MGLNAIINTGTAVARKSKPLAQNLPKKLSPDLIKILFPQEPKKLSPDLIKILYQETPITEKIQKLTSRYATEQRTFNINGKDIVAKVFKGSQEGSNKGYWITLTGKDLRYVKFLSEQHGYSEKLASDLYNLAGIPSAKMSTLTETLPRDIYERINTNINYGIISDFIPFERELSIADAKLAREGFGVDCWLANWDALKSGNTVIQNGKALRLDVGGSLCYRARGARKTGEQFGENVNELTSFFDNFSHSKMYIKDMSRDELINSLEKVTKLSDLSIRDLIKKSADFHMNCLGNPIPRQLKNPEYLSEVLIARKKYLQTFVDKCKTFPQNSDENIEQYVRRIDAMMPKKKYTLPFDTFTMPSEMKNESGLSMGICLIPSQKALYEECAQAYKTSSKRKLLGIGTSSPNIGRQELLHATIYDRDSFSQILDKGIISRELSKKNGTGVGTQTPLCADFWEVLENMSIKEYFTRPHYNTGELNFLPKIRTNGGLDMASGGGTLVFIFDKNKIDPILLKNSVSIYSKKTPDGMQSILYKDHNFAGHHDYITHRAIPIGVPSNALSKIVVNTSNVTNTQIAEMKQIMAKKGMNINLYDLEGNVL